MEREQVCNMTLFKQEKSKLSDSLHILPEKQTEYYKFKSYKLLKRRRKEKT